MRSNVNTIGDDPTDALAVDKIIRAVAMFPSDVPSPLGFAVYDKTTAPAADALPLSRFTAVTTLDVPPVFSVERLIIEIGTAVADVAIPLI